MNVTEIKSGKKLTIVGQPYLGRNGRAHLLVYGEDGQIEEKEARMLKVVSEDSTPEKESEDSTPEKESENSTPEKESEDSTPEKESAPVKATPKPVAKKA